MDKTVGQIWRFVTVGVINTFIDFAILNLLSKVTHIGIQDPGIIYLNIISFAVATTNSYFMNKYWSFADSSTDRPKQFTVFLLVSIAGVLINSGTLKAVVYLAPGFVAWVAHAVSVVLPLAFWQKIDLTLNIAKAMATAVSLVWNFLGYKLFVFKK